MAGCQFAKDILSLTKEKNKNSMTAQRYLVYKLFRFFVGYLNIYYIFL